MKPDFAPSPDLYPFRSPWFQSSVGPVHYIDEGEGRPIVFSHGQPMWSFLYRNIVKGLRDRFRCVVLDYPGYGLSVRPDSYGYTPGELSAIVLSLVDHLGLDDMIVMGQDWGGPIGMSMAAGRPDKVSGIVLANTWLWRDVGFSMRLFSMGMSTGLMQRRILENNTFIEFGIPRSVSKTLPDEVMEHYRAVQPSPSMRAAQPVAPREILGSGDWLAELETQVRANLSTTPTLLIWGMKDRAFGPKYLERMKDIFADRVVVELPNAKHYIQEDEPDQVITSIIRRFS